jgi:hypothetical protein
MINPWFGLSVDFNSHCKEEEASDFVSFLLECFGDYSVKIVVGRTEKALAKGSEVSGKTARAESKVASHQAMLQLLAPSTFKAENGAWTIDRLLSDTLHNDDLVFTELNSSLVLQLPRYGKDQRVIGDVVPDRMLHVVTDGTCPSKVLYELRAVIVIGTSHFVSYLRVPKSEDVPCPSHFLAAPKDDQALYEYAWLYCDSMSDRLRDRNVPIIVDVTQELEILETQDASALVGAELVKPGREHLRRIVQDMSMAFYCRTGWEELETKPCSVKDEREQENSDRSK